MRRRSLDSTAGHGERVLWRSHVRAGGYKIIKINTT